MSKGADFSVLGRWQCVRSRIWRTVSFFAISWATLVIAGPLDFQGTWRNTTTGNEIKLASSSDTIVGRYVNIDNSSTFIGHVVPRDRAYDIFWLIQYQGNYHAIYNGVRKGDTISCSVYDEDGYHVDYTWVKQKPTMAKSVAATPEIDIAAARQYLINGRISIDIPRIHSLQKTVGH